MWRWTMRTLSRSVRAARALTSGAGVAAAPCRNTVIPLRMRPTTSAAEAAWLVQSLCIRHLKTRMGRDSARPVGGKAERLQDAPGGGRGRGGAGQHFPLQAIPDRTHPAVVGDRL